MQPTTTPGQAQSLPVTRIRLAIADQLDCDLVVVGGVPGAGKSTAIARAIDDIDTVWAVDPEHITWWFRRHLPASVPYPTYRWAVHVLHTLRVLAYLLHGPVAGRTLVIHDPGTRARRRGLFHAVARSGGWRMVSVYLDVDMPAAQDGQIRRGRMVPSFGEHWRSWLALRPGLVAEDRATRTAIDAGPSSSPMRTGRAEPVLLVGREEAAAILRRLCRGS